MLRAVTLVCLLLAVPVLGVLGSWLVFDADSLATLRHQWQTVLPEYALQLDAARARVGVGVALVGGATAAAVSLFDFPLRRVFEWALLLPLAMPAYVLAYAYTDFLQFSGPLQTGLRALTGAQGALWPDVRSLPGAVSLFVLCLYPYVYLLTRAALGERAVPLMEAARLLGAGTLRRVREVALPLARPALAAGVALALMETLADYGVGSYFGLATVTTGIYKAWLVMNDRVAAAQLASVLLAGVALLLWLERRAQRRLRFAAGRARRGARRRGAADSRCTAPLRRSPSAVCALPVLLGFVAAGGGAAAAGRDAGGAAARSTPPPGRASSRLGLDEPAPCAAAPLRSPWLLALALAFARRARDGAACCAGRRASSRSATRCRAR